MRLKWFGESLMRILCFGEESDGGLMRLKWFGESLMRILCLGEESDEVRMVWRESDEDIVSWGRV